MHRDDEVFSAFVRAQTPRLAEAAYLLTGGADGTEDLLQSAFAATYAQWHKLADLDDAARHLRKALWNHHSTWRRRHRRPEFLVPRAPAPAVAPDAAAVEERLALLAALRCLSDRQRAVVVLRFFDGCTEPEVADLLGCSIGSVKQHAHRGLSRLRQILSTPTTGALPAPTPEAVQLPC